MTTLDKLNTMQAINNIKGKRTHPIGTYMLLGFVVLLLLLGATARAEAGGYGRHYGGHHGHHGHGFGGFIAGAIIGGALAYRAPRYYAPPPVYYPAPVYRAPPVYWVAPGRPASPAPLYLPEPCCAPAPPCCGYTMQ